jgi:hypothetical protein
MAGWPIRLLVSLGSGFVLAVLVGIVLAVVDLYLSGHGYRPLGAPLLDWPALGVHLSLADVIFLGVGGVGTWITWRSFHGGRS